MKGFSVEEAKRLREAQDVAAYFSYCSEFADDPEAQAHLAFCCYHGYGVDQDLAQAVDWYAKAAEAGHAQATCALGLCYDNGEGVARDRAEAMRLYELAAARGYELANYYLALCHEEAGEAAQAAALYEPLVQEGYVAAYARMGLLLAEGRGVTQDLARAEELLATCTDYAASFYDDELAQIWRVLADCRQALGGDAREAEDAALALYDSLADSDESGESAYWAGKLLAARGEDKAAFRRWEQALLAGWRPAVLRVAQAYEHGRGVARDTEKAYAVLCAQASQGDAYFRVLQAVHLEYGVGVAQDVEKARTLLETSGEEMAKYFLALLDDRSAANCYTLALIYQHDFYYIKAAPELAYRYAQEACDLDPQPNHLSMLARLVFSGSGCPRDLERACALYEQAGDERAEQALAEYRYYGVVLAQDDAVAVRAFAAGVQRDDRRAMLYLGLCHLHGRGLSVDAAQALALFERAAAGNGYYARYAAGIAALVVLSQPALAGDAEAARATLARLAETSSIWTQIDRFYAAAPTPELAALFLELVETKLSERYLKRPPLTYYAGRVLRVQRLVKAYAKSGADVRGLQQEIVRLEKALAQSQAESESKDALLAEKEQSIAALSDDVAFYRDVLSRGVATVEEKVDAVHAATQDIQQAIGELSELVSGAFMDELRGAKETLRAQLETTPPEAQDALVDAMCRQINDAINSAMAHASDAIVSQEEAHLERLFGESWQKLLPLSRASIVSASVLWQGCAGVTMPDFDYSGICISVTTALEAELRRVFFDGFGDYLAASYGAPETLAPEEVFAIWPEKLLSMTQREYARAKKPKLKRQHVFTIGNLPFLLGERRERYSSAEQQALVQQRAAEYLATIVKPEFADAPREVFTAAHGGESFVDKCERIRNDYRNAAAHAQVVSRDQAIACYHAVIGRIGAYDHISGVTSALLALYSVLK